MSDLSRVHFRTKNNIAFVSLNRPEKHNGLDEQLFRELIGTAKRIRKDKSIRAVVLSGEGESFCAGLDFKALQKNPMMVPKLFLKLPWTSANNFQRVAYIWKTLPVPVICAVHGNCFGGGLQIALGADYRIATPDSKWSIMEVKWGLIPDMSATTTLTTLTRYDIAMELTMTGRVFSGEEGYQYGLVSNISDTPLADAEALAEVISQKSPDQVAATKLLFRKTWKAGPRLALLWERWIQTRLLGRKNQSIAMKNGLAGKDKPAKPFADRSLF
ncbi:crotonase/enoyl-CoA hydratase family protein [Parendozoicomonas haliclonae]|uniref:Putative enoyl-CoA hydratase echA8 n=1 Tax=Parendozoicomonas haliclonae TaxID=1960125 RepID=A0A1X7AJY7_9GAMM|nr:crotonase/enoyl-CoA hydratase family protein [Parendozoicomonas haliclonae]SMA46380.1 putative enoyl-CoA hydratase echA8 [Parendozoicomonas haliclonae]